MFRNLLENKSLLRETIDVVGGNLSLINTGADDWRTRQEKRLKGLEDDDDAALAHRKRRKPKLDKLQGIVNPQIVLSKFQEVCRDEGLVSGTNTSLRFFNGILSLTERFALAKSRSIMHLLSSHFILT